MKFLKNHPFAVEAFFESSLVLTFAVPPSELESLIPECLTLDTFKDQWAFIAVAMVQTKELRPKGFPAFVGNDFFLIGYRIFVRYQSTSGKRLRGLYILKSETDKKRMEFLGNIFTHYKYSTTDIEYVREGDLIRIHSEQSDFELHAKLNAEAGLPTDSPFREWKEARRFAGPLPFTFSYNAPQQEVYIIEGVRSNWKPTPIEVNRFRFSYLESLNLKKYQLANAFVIQDIPYFWRKGRKESLGC